ncbi:hypothetical protein [Wolbachia endosymbiont of Litomosoides brasiliensis]|uniref:hypothetical protein n=1 Tax=Wolbachia endosymbiont of Litomosoides brasiliensis TaxID=1812117 RepID=UPI00158AFF85
MESAKEVLKKVQSNAYVANKLSAVIAAKKKYSITAVQKYVSLWIKHLMLIFIINRSNK